MDQRRYIQLSQFIKTLLKPLHTLTYLTPMESILPVIQPPQKTISHFYRALMTLESTSFPNFLQTWEQGLQRPLSDDQCATVLQLADTSSISSKIAEVNYRILTTWHLTPAQLHKIFADTSELCWRGCGAGTTRAWGHCPLKDPF